MNGWSNTDLVDYLSKQIKKIMLELDIIKDEVKTIKDKLNEGR